MKRFVDWLKRLFGKWDREQRFYAVGIAVGVASVGVLMAAKQQTAWSNLLMFASLIAFGAGLITWLFAAVWPRVRRSTPDRLFGVGKGLFHIVIAWLALAFARSEVGRAVGLPPEDFELTVLSVTVVTYILALFFVVAAAAGALATVLLLLTFALMAVSFLSPWVTVVAAVFRTDAPRLWLERIRARGDIWALRAFGFWAVLVLLTTAVFEPFDKEAPRFHAAIRWVAFHFDYRELRLYPGIPSGLRVRIHENLISCATKDAAGTVVIRVDGCTLPQRP